MSKRQPKQTNKSIFLLTEGEETEPNYFNAIKQVGDLQEGYSLTVKASKNRSPYQMVEEAIKHKSKNTYYEVWCIFDHDTHDKLADAFDLAEKEGINVAFTAICFEVWILFHYVYTTRAFQNSDQVIAEIKRYMKEYNKDYEKLYEQTKDKLHTAIAHAEKLRKSLEQPDRRLQNPYVDVDRLIKQIVNENVIRPPSAKK
jgi:hypothetical protein